MADCFIIVTVNPYIELTLFYLSVHHRPKQVLDVCRLSHSWRKGYPSRLNDV